MKKIISTFIVLLFCCYAFSQNNIQWKSIDNNQGEFNYKTLIKASEQEIKTVFTISHNKVFKKTTHSIFIRKYNGDMTNFTEDGIPAESPRTVGIMGFRDYNVFYGTMDANVSSNEWMNQPNKVVISDNSMNTLLNLTFPLHNKHNRFETIPQISVSSDSNYLIIVNNELIEANNFIFKDPKINYYVDVYDKYLNHVWCDSVICDSVFGKAYQIQEMKFNFYDNKLVATAYYQYFIWGTPKPVIFVVVYDKPQSYKVIMKQVFARQGIAFNTLFDKSGKIFFSGNAIHVPAVGNPGPGNYKNQLFYLCKDLNLPDEPPVFKCYDIDDKFMENFQKQKQFFEEHYFNPNQLIFHNNKLYYIDDHITSYINPNGSPLTKYNFDQLLFMAFDLQGNIEWISSIRKKVSVKDFHDLSAPLGRVYLKGDDLGIFYYDNVKNVFNKKLKSIGATLKGLCLVNATLSPEGKIDKTIVSNIGETKKWVFLNDIRVMANHKYLFMGRGIDFKIKDVYTGFYSDTK